MSLFDRILKKGYRRLLLMAILLVSSFSVSACRGLELENKTEQIAGYTESQAMIVLVNELNRYRSAYTDAILDVTVEGEDKPFEEVLIDNVREYLEQIKLLCMLAEEQRVTVTSQERDSIRDVSELYYSGLSAEDLEHIGCSIEDVQTVYEDIFQADKLIRRLTESAQSDISDSEAKVIEVQQIVTSDLKKALAILKLCKIDGADFATMASRYTESEEVTRELRRGSIGGLYEETAFSLDEGDISNIIECDGLYYIIKCTNGYDQEATADRKAMLEAAINTKAFSEVYDSYREEHPVRFGERFWNDLDLSEALGTSVDDFFELYDENLSF